MGPTVIFFGTGAACMFNSSKENFRWVFDEWSREHSEFWGYISAVDVDAVDVLIIRKRKYKIKREKIFIPPLAPHMPEPKIINTNSISSTIAKIANFFMGPKKLEHFLTMGIGAVPCTYYSQWASMWLLFVEPHVFRLASRQVPPQVPRQVPPQNQAFPRNNLREL